jgi:hypothetical protein
MVMPDTRDAEFADLVASFTTGTGLVTTVAGGIINALAASVAAVALHRVILFGERRPGRFFHWSFGRAEKLFTAVMLVTQVISIGSLVIFVYVVPGFLAVIIGLLSFVVFIYVITRFALIFPVMVVEERVDLALAQRLTSGRFWRLFGIFVLVVVPMLIVQAVLQPLVVFGTFLPTAEALASVGMPALIRVLVLNYVFTIALAALGVALLSYAYKALTEHAPEETVRPQGRLSPA